MAATGELADKTAVVTGGSSGIGRSIALRFSAEGAAVVIADKREAPREGGRPTHETIRAERDGQARYVECDVTDNQAIETVMETADEYGGIDVLVNNAGILLDKPFVEVTEQEFWQTMNVNVKGCFFAAQTAAKRMKSAGGGSIINLSSVGGLRGGATVAYCTSKGAVTLLTYSLAQVLGPHGIRVNSVHPSFIPSEMLTHDTDYSFGGDDGDLAGIVPLGRRGTTDEIANGVTYLASDRASYVNGESHVVDGGWTHTSQLSG